LPNSGSQSLAGYSRRPIGSTFQRPIPPTFRGPAKTAIPKHIAPGHLLDGTLVKPIVYWGWGCWFPDHCRPSKSRPRRVLPATPRFDFLKGPITEVSKEIALEHQLDGLLGKLNGSSSWGCWFPGHCQTASLETEILPASYRSGNGHPPKSRSQTCIGCHSRQNKRPFEMGMSVSKHV
jgi:hypothetical protein